MQIFLGNDLSLLSKTSVLSEQNEDLGLSFRDTNTLQKTLLVTKYFCLPTFNNNAY